MRVTTRLYGVLLLLFTTLAVAAQPSEQPRGITPEDYYAFEFLREPRISPDGKLVAYVLTTVDRKQNRRSSSVWMVATDGTRAPWQFTTSPQDSSSPQWSPDGQALAFISSRPGVADAAAASEGAAAANRPKKQVYVLSMSGGEARRVTDLKNGADAFQWSPDGTRLAVLSRTGPSDSRPENRERSDVRHYSQQLYKTNDTGWFDDKRTHIWIVDVKSGQAAQLTSGDDWDDRDPQWSPDGKRLAFVSDRTGRAYEESRNTDVWVINVAGGPLVKISDHAEQDESPRWSPDGKTIAFTGSVTERDHPKIWLAPSAGGAASTLAVKDLDLIPSDLEWSPDGRSLYFGAGVRGEYQLFRAGLSSREARPITVGPRAVRNMDISPRGGRMTYTVNDFKHLDDLYVADLDARGERRLTNLNQGLWAKLQLQDVERFTYKGADGLDVDGFFVKPVGWQPRRKYPMILNIHGGPASMYGVDWFHEFQVYAARGWAVFYTNPRGSTGYGQRFERAIEGEWGGKDYVDIMNGVEAALQRYPWVDRERLGVTGGSYGGFMTNWIVGHTNLFKAAVTLRSVSNFISDEGTRDYAYGHKADFGGDLFEKFDLYWERSPLKYARNVRTPTLVLHSDNDLRVPIEQGEQWYRALKHFGVTTELVIFPRENHNLTRTGEPRHLVESLNWQVYWFDRFINGNAGAVPPDRR
ncbi:MAG TPA: S9 family peptidase [Pyrinomonadaceae bacterium]|jgi:dipeptidyl aminopeptidase/acylaminoacyl peptidase